MDQRMDQREFPRMNVVTTQHIIRFTEWRSVDANIVLTRNVSASGFCFRSAKSYAAGEYLLIYLNNSVLEEVKENRAQVMKAGNYFLARVIWKRSEHPLSDGGFFEVGCAFVNIVEASLDKVELFINLVNSYTAEKLSTAMFSRLP
ncbi:MAG: hypothetical protein A3G32_00440 [Deltaproteobacteria bacterium RIFCSPLOWO2_12_FULL_40_28]|nr:MAG: hypothetical protein A3C45_03595 [Deltaproteobacteria bacterium RIFCSPHIGHO2_02_FULL_40_28]OGQ53642.1 MAG: hypothetical protein A3G32_00440 [Deltaproteobacteria bacterium RIFCSPLOWO2_12_FULL_40_28]